MRVGYCGRRLVASALTVLPLALPAHAGALRPSRSCSMADAQAVRPLASTAPSEGSAETALAVEAQRPLPSVAPAAHDSSAPSPAAMPDYEARAVPPNFLAMPEPPKEADVGPPEPLRAVERSAAIDAGGAPEDAPLAFRDYRAPKERFRAWRELRLLRLWDDTRVSVWFGLDRKGRPGLHFRQRNPGEEVPLARVEPYADAPPLRSVPLTSP